MKNRKEPEPSPMLVTDSDSKNNGSERIWNTAWKFPVRYVIFEKLPSAYF